MGTGVPPVDRWAVSVASASAFRPHAAALAAVLSPEERRHVDGLADPWTATFSRAVLRLLLARHLGVAPAAVDLERTCPTCGRPHGRPRLRAAGSGGAPLQLSVSHGGDLLVLAVARTGPLGIDVEPVTPAVAVGAELLELTLTPDERRHVERAPAEGRPWTFLHYWTGKEAVLKAVGSGLELSLQAVTLTPPPDGRATVTAPSGVALDLVVRHLDVGAAHVCALATADGAGETRLEHLSPAALLAL